MRPFDRLTYNALRILVRTLGRLPLERTEVWGRRVGRVWYRLDAGSRKTARKNLETAFGREMSPGRIEDLTQAVFFNTARMFFEYAWYYTQGFGRFDEFFQVKGIEHLHQAQSLGRGTIALTGHLGNWELALSMGPISGYPVSIVYRAIKSRGIDQYIRDNRARFHCRMYPLHKALEGILQALTEGHLVGLLADQNCGLTSGVFIDFFGRQACTHAGVAKLARSTQAPVLPIFIYREDGRFTLEVQPEVPLVKTDDEEADILANTQNYQTAIETIVRRFPDQWFWVHKRWKTRPPEETIG